MTVFKEKLLKIRSFIRIIIAAPKMYRTLKQIVFYSHGQRLPLALGLEIIIEAARLIDKIEGKQ